MDNGASTKSTEVEMKQEEVEGCEEQGTESALHMISGKIWVVQVIMAPF